MNTIKITMHDDGSLSVDIKDPIPFEEFISVNMTLLLGAMHNTVDNAPKDKQEEAKGTIYDMVNVAASRVLEQFAPEYELRPNLTAQAILEAENKIIKEGRLSEVEQGT